MKSLKSLFLTLAATALISGAVHAAPIEFANVNLDPTGVGADPTGANSQQICPNGLPCAGNNFVSADPNEFTITMLEDGLWSGSITQSQTPSGTGIFNVPSTFTLVGFGSGTPGNPLEDIFLAAGVYTIEVTYDFTGGVSPNATGSASWAMTMTTAVVIDDLPEPGTLALMGIALAGVGLARRRRH